ncbi:MAG TPA: GGDEF domain-containing protein [Bryobacteraceae bacterium]|nr:GGDEF domain-containing protein [Bryobacteraceae bacterium]
MISIRKHIDNYRDGLGEPALSAFRSSLVAMAHCGERAIPPLGSDLNRKLSAIHESLQGGVTSEDLRSASQRVEQELSLWADLALRQHHENEREMKEIVDAVARAAESVSQRDEKYSHEIRDLTGRLRTIAGMNDLSAIRRSIVESAAALKACVEQMAEASRASVSHLSREVEEYRARLSESERLSGLDPLTGIGNRRAFEAQLTKRIKKGVTFSLVMMDLNGFKSVNDRHGHLAGDDLLKQFALELEGQTTASDFVGRWGGDEFVLIIAGDFEEANARVERLRKWVFGEYRIGEGNIRTVLEASVGIAEWDGQESGVELLARADEGAYRLKAQAQGLRSSKKRFNKAVDSAPSTPSMTSTL